MLKLEDNPPILYPETSEITEIYGQWWVAHTKSRNEKALAQILRRWDIPYFLPQIEKISRGRGRHSKSMLPLFSGYVFFSGNHDTRYQAMTTNRIANIIEVIDQNGLIKDLAQIHKALSSGVQLDPHPHLKAGMACRIIAGPLMGLEGILIRKKSVSRLILKVEILGQGAGMEIDADMLEPLEFANQCGRK